MIIDQFEKQVKKYPERLAVKTGPDELTYQQLNDYANALAQVIINQFDGDGLSDQLTAALLFEHSNEMIVGVIGALKAARIYVPMDPNYPTKLLGYMLENCEAKLIITNDKNMELAELLIRESNSEAVIINVSTIKMMDSQGFSNPKLDENDIAYILYTSGSTGRPKGVMQSHKSVLHFASCYGNALTITPEDRVTLLASFSHDGAVGDIFLALLNGASLHPLDVKANMPINGIASWVQEEGISIWHSVPTLYRHFINTLNEGDDFPLRYIVLGGESVLLNDIDQFQKNFPSAKFAILYGQSESSINSIQTYTAACQVEMITLGEPIQGTEMLVVDENREEVSPLNVGEIVVLSDYVAHGYWKDEEKSREVFRDIPGIGRTYWTGDLGKLLLDDRIEFFGRKDFQVKIRGFRVELEGIENQLLQHPVVKEAVVIVKEDKVKPDGAQGVTAGEKYLRAYIVADHEIAASELRNYLAASLPDYMIPSYFVQLEKMPLTPTGKVNRKALVELHDGVGVEYVAPRNQIEIVLAQIWCEVLAAERVGINDNFFELGGHSLRGITLISKIHKELQVEIPLKELFRRETIAALSEYIISASKSVYAAIEPAVTREHYEVSSAQKRMWLLQQFDLGNMGYNMPRVLIIDGNLDRNRLTVVFKSLIARHETLRTSFEMAGDVVIQKIAHDVDFWVETFEMMNKDADEQIRDFIRPFDLSQAPLLRVGLIKLNETSHYLLIDMHHIISDGVSMGILTKEFVELYDGKTLAEQRLQYKDFAQWQNKYLQSEKIREQEKYWLERFSGELPRLNMPLDYPRPAMQSFAGDRIEFALDEELTNSLKTISRDAGATLYMVLLSAVNILLAKYTGQDDIIVGSPIAGRPHADLEGIIGMFVNTLAMRNFPANTKRYGEFLKEVKEHALEAYANQDYQFEELVDKLNLHRDLNRNPVFDVVFVLQNMGVNVLEIEGLQFTEYDSGQDYAKFDLTITAFEAKEKVLFKVEYCRDLFRRETIAKFVMHLQNLIKAIAADPNTLLGEIDILSEDERHQLLCEYNNRLTEELQAKTIPQLFEEQVQKTPDQLAIVFEENELTYGELNEKVNQLASVLRSHGVQPNHIVGLMTQRSPLMIIGILAILKAGGAYLPIDPDHPEERIQFMIADSEANILLTESSLSNKLPSTGIKINLDEVDLSQGEGEGDLAKGENLEAANSPSDLAYVIYTSGSTGMPKGVLVEHRNVTLLIESGKELFDITAKDIWTMFHAYNFDFSVWEMYGALLIGGKLIIVPKETARNPKLFRELLVKEKVTILNQTPAAFYMLSLEEMEQEGNDLCVEKIIFGGEALEVSKLRNWHAKYPHTKMINMYGITETTVHVTYKFISHEEIVAGKNSIGKPLPTYTMYMVDPSLNLLPVGVVGEMLVGGSGVTRGYLNRQSLTAEKFIANPFTPSGRLYRTGDLARWLPDGSVEFLGRIDHQVKIRGYRIELGEIENRLAELETLQEVIVIARDEEETGEKYLCAYMVIDGELQVNDLRRQLSKKLPDYMIPQYFVQLERLPLTANGKVDRKALPTPVGEVQTEYVAPRNELEIALAQIWRKILGVERVGIYDNFFELGGHSLKAVAVINNMNRELGTNIPLAELYANPNLAAIAEYIEFVKRSELKSVDGLILLKSGAAIDKHFFIIHAGHSDGAVFIKLANSMDHTFNYWGINYEEPDAVGPHVMPMEELAARYIAKIKKVQEEGPYYISGWCFGGAIAVEIARQMEAANDEIRFVGLYNADGVNKFKVRRHFIRKKFTMKTELALLREIFPEYKFHERYSHLRIIEDLWKLVVEELEAAEAKDKRVKEDIYNRICDHLPLIRKIIKAHGDANAGKLIHYLNRHRGMMSIYVSYNPKRRVNSQLSYFIASKEAKPGRVLWNKQSYKPVNFYRIDADHFSMIEDDKDVKKTALILTNVLKSLN